MAFSESDSRRFNMAKVRALESRIRSLEQEVAHLQDRLNSEEGKVISLKRRFDFVLKETQTRERKQAQTQIQALRHRLEMISFKELQQSQERWHRQFQADLSRQSHIHEEEMRKMRRNYEEKMSHLKSQLDWSKQAILQSQEEHQSKFLVLEQVCQCQQRPSSSSIISRPRPWGNSGPISRSAVTINDDDDDDDPLIHSDSCRYLQSSTGGVEVPSRNFVDQCCCYCFEDNNSNHLKAVYPQPSFVVSAPTHQPKSEPNLVRVGQELGPQRRNLSLKSILRPDLDSDSSDEEYFSMYSSLEYTPVRDFSGSGGGGVGSSSYIPRIRRHSSE
ncbi:uncharacterized protein LOC131881138 isoform X2 [Tigriopus californicus]|uniref:uncharacterized protein LOC131881138 isoform X2 n=1 Tax=Tigriopus californicus TaxID=6832 RepID=UPI0027DA2DFD|nr:uncharacterized protein LOC131881138 isoform X2 [Tigriopus californicus]